MRQASSHLITKTRRAWCLLFSLLLILQGVALLGGNAAAAQVTQRSLTIGSAVASASTSYNFGFTLASTSAVQGLKFQACTTALGSCTAPAGLSFSSAAFSTQTGWAQTGNFAVDATGANDCVASASILCAKRTQATAENSGTAVTAKYTTITNPDGTSCSTVNCTFFVRLTTYSLNTYTAGSIVDNGTVAASTTQSLSVAFTIQEILSFCIGATTIDNATTTTPPACSGISGTSLNLGTLDSSHVNVSPVPSGANGDSNNGIAELSTNAANGAAVTYDAVQQSGTNHQGDARVVGASCNSGNVNTDQCINSAGILNSGNRTTLTAGTEAFGMTIAGVNCKLTTAYSCSYTSNTYNLRKAANYDGTNVATTYLADAGQVSGTTAGGYDWDESGAANTIASSSTAVDSEALILKFAATPNLVTPTGSYTAKADFIATPTF